jgi:hypothetical protein
MAAHRNVEVVGYDAGQVWVACLSCRATWDRSAARYKDKLPRRWRDCPNGCNAVAKPRPRPNAGKFPAVIASEVITAHPERDVQAGSYVGRAEVDQRRDLMLVQQRRIERKLAAVRLRQAIKAKKADLAKWAEIDAEPGVTYPFEEDVVLEQLADDVDL